MENQPQTNPEPSQPTPELNHNNEQGELGAPAAARPSRTHKPKRPKMSKRKKIILFSALGVLILASAVAGFVFLNQPQPEPEPNNPVTEAPPPPPPKYYANLSGLLVENQNQVDAPVTAVIIENLYPSARPQSGLKDAEVVFEAIAEGGITRFMALYQLNKPKLIGPVRSLRPYYIDYFEPFDAGIAHVGGSEEALRRIRNGGYLDLDQFTYASSYWRSTDRYAPHNVYTNFERLDALNQQKQHTNSKVDAFKRQDSKKSEAPDAQSISVLFGNNPSYNIAYQYSAQTNTYKRSMGGAPHIDRELGQIETDVVVAVLAQQGIATDRVHTEIKTIGSGTAYVFQNGTATKATWKKPSAKTQIRFYDSDGEEIALNRGKIWISVPPNNPSSVTWK